MERTTYSTMRNRREDRDQDQYPTVRQRRKDSALIQGIKTGGDIIMYAGSAGLMIPAIQKAKENQNGILGACAVGAGAIISIGVGNIACNFLHSAIDKVVDFFNDVKPKEKKEDEDDG